MYSETKVTVRYAETDQMGIVHHSVYPVWYEATRTEYIKMVGLTYSEVEKMGVMMPVSRLTCKYIKPCFYEDCVTIRVSIAKLTPARIEFYYEVYRQGDEKPINTGTSEHAWTNKEMNIVNLKKSYPELYKKLEDLNE
jgi:acyl-CoA thioester hydrolase